MLTKNKQTNKKKTRKNLKTDFFWGVPVGGGGCGDMVHRGLAIKFDQLDPCCGSRNIS